MNFEVANAPACSRRAPAGHERTTLASPQADFPINAGVLSGSRHHIDQIETTPRATPYALAAIATKEEHVVEQDILGYLELAGIVVFIPHVNFSQASAESALTRGARPAGPAVNLNQRVGRAIGHASDDHLRHRASGPAQRAGRTRRTAGSAANHNTIPVRKNLQIGDLTAGPALTPGTGHNDIRRINLDPGKISPRLLHSRIKNSDHPVPDPRHTSEIVG